jgi:hypothetical protein
LATATLSFASYAAFHLANTAAASSAGPAKAITNYFTVVVGTGNKVEFRDHQVVPLNEQAVLVVGFNDFLRNRGGQLTPEPARFTMVLVKEGNDWLIAHHHSSLRPPPPTSN